MDGAKALDKYHIPARYPNGFETGAPVDYYTHAEVKNGIRQAEALLEYCGNQID